MYAQVGFCDNPDSACAGREAVRAAMALANRADPCQMVLLFATARHDAETLYAVVRDAVGPSALVVGGGAVGVITNTHYGYAGDQVGLALIWFDQVQCELMVESGLDGSEHEVAARLGARLKARGMTPESPMVLFYDAIDRSRGDIRLVMATYLLEALEQSLGFLPQLVGAGLQGDFILTPTRQWTGHGLKQHAALALMFSGSVRMDHVVMHGCRPGTGYYTVTRADGQTILEINGIPALTFMSSLLQDAVPVEHYPFFLIFGVNRGDKWGAYNENSYASRLCLGIDRERQGIVMFEPDMVAGTEFQLMYRNLEPDYMAPRLDALFAGLQGRTPVFALYIDCAGRAAGYGGSELEDALVVQQAALGNVPLLGVYSGVEIGSIEGKSRGLDWSGVFCLFSVPSK